MQMFYIYIYMRSRWRRRSGPRYLPLRSATTAGAATTSRCARALCAQKVASCKLLSLCLCVSGSVCVSLSVSLCQAVVLHQPSTPCAHTVYKRERESATRRVNRYLTSHAGTAHHGQMHQAGMEPGDICGGAGYRLSVSCKPKPQPAAAAIKTAGTLSCPANKSNVQCGGLKNDKAADGSAELCAAACCADSAGTFSQTYRRLLTRIRAH